MDVGLFSPLGVNFLDFQVLVTRHIGRPNMHRRAKFHQNRSNGCGDIAFNVLHHRVQQTSVSYCLLLATPDNDGGYSQMMLIVNWRQSSADYIQCPALRIVWWIIMSFGHDASHNINLSASAYTCLVKIFGLTECHELHSHILPWYADFKFF